jgi:hypothetical protein
MFDPRVFPVGPSKPYRLPARRPTGLPRDGIEVREEQLGSVAAQHLYRLRCECGRSWFELELPKVVRCPACAKLGAVSL